MSKYFLLAFPAASFGLGVWQVKRLSWKKDLIENINNRTSSEAIDLMSINSLQDLDSLEYHKVKVTGRYEAKPKQIFIKPRTLVLNKEARLRGRSENHINTGVLVVTPFRLDNSNLRILVNRGWLPLRKYREFSDQGLDENEGKPIEITGILRLSEKMRGINVANDVTGDEWNYRDVNAIASALETAPIYIDLVENPVAGINPFAPIGGQTRLTIKNDHLSYAITWFGLCVLTTGMWYSKFGPKKIIRPRV